MAYRPRGAFARMLYEKVHNDDYLDQFDTRLWYNLPQQLHHRYQSKFIQFEQPDNITLEWLREAKELSANLWLQIWHVVARLFLGVFMTQTDVNGLLKRGSMFILSESQYRHLLEFGGFLSGNLSNEISISMLDIGAGDGKVTQRLVKAVQGMNENVQLTVYATEYSWIMRGRLQEKDYTVLEKLTDISNVHLISCLNVLDRCADPHLILNDIYTTLSPDGRVIIALVLPYSHYVETNTTHLPVRPLLPYWPNITNVPFVEEVVCFFEQIENIGFQVEAWTKAPYLCEGDIRQSFYWLTDVVVILSKRKRNLNSDTCNKCI